MSEEKLTKKQRKEARRVEKQIERDRQKKIEERKTMSYWAVGIIIVLLIAFAIFKSITAPNDGTTIEGELSPEVSQDDHIKGNPEAQVTLVEYGDFQCPACASYSGIISEVGEKYKDRLRIVYRHFPLTSIHDNAINAARATEAAALQDKFWEMHDQLYDNHSFPGVLKSILDLLGDEYTNKAAGIVSVSSGAWAGKRGVEALLPVLRALGLKTTTHELSFPQVESLFDERKSLTDDACIRRTNEYLDELVWLGKALRLGRKTISTHDG